MIPVFSLSRIPVAIETGNVIFSRGSFNNRSVVNSLLKLILALILRSNGHLEPFYINKSL